QMKSDQPSAQGSGAMEDKERGRRGARMARRGAYAPSMFALSPGAVFSMSPFELMRRFTDELDRAFEGLGIAHGAGGGEIQMWTPSVEVFERDNNLVVRAELPGTDPGDVRIEMTDDGLVIEGERRREDEERLEGGYRSEIEYGRFYRLIPLPEGANLDQAQARLNNGVLEVAIPMAEERRRRRSIPVETGAGREARTGGEKAPAARGQAQNPTSGAGRKGVTDGGPGAGDGARARGARLAVSRSRIERNRTMRNGIRIGRISGVSIYIDWSWIFIFLLVTFSLAGGVLFVWHPDWNPWLTWAVAFAASLLLFASVLLHEVAHALVARARGLPVRKITLFLFGGASNIEREPDSPKTEFLMALIGPGVSIVLGVIFLLAGLVLAGESGQAMASPVETF